MTADNLMAWAIRHQVGMGALDDLRAMLLSAPPAPGTGSEARVASAVRLEAGRRGDVVLWRNNVGALKDEQGRWVRYGLANESKAQNERIKSADLVGIYRRIIQPGDVGRVIGQFLSVETKREGWKPGNNDHDNGQAAWGAGVVAWGGLSITHASASMAAFANLPGEGAK